MARDYAKVAPQFWTGKTGRLLRKQGADVQLAALYLITGPHANALGLYYLALPTFAHEMGIPLEGASKALQTLCEGGFCAYDEESETVWVFEMARYQLGDQLKAADNRVRWVREVFDSVADCQLKRNFARKYGVAYHLASGGVERGFGGASDGVERPFEARELREERKEKEEIHTSGTTVNEGRARAQAVPGGVFGEGLRPVHVKAGEGEQEKLTCTEGQDAATGSDFPGLDVGLEFQELRAAYDATARAEAPLAGFAEYKQLRCARAWPGLPRIDQALDVWSTTQRWKNGFAPGLARFLRERWWLLEPTEADRRGKTGCDAGRASAPVPQDGSIRPGAAEIDARIAAARAAAR